MFKELTIEKMALFVFFTNIFRYLLLAGTAYLLFYVVLKKKLISSKIQSKFPKNKDYYREIGYSVLTFLVFTLVGLFLYNPYIRPYTQTYYEVNQYGYAYFFMSFFVTLILHDTYFYWTHRLMHHPKLFRLFHDVHHQSTNPSPWASFSFQPTEAFVEAGIFIVFAFVMPFHIYVLMAFLLFMTTYNVYGHLGWEIYPKSFARSIFGKWLNTSISHNLHHQFFKGNYGLYFMFWDKIMGTMTKNYEETFESALRP